MHARSLHNCIYHLWHTDSVSFSRGIGIQVITFFTEIVDPLMWGISWKALFAAHRVSAIVLFIGGAYVGFREGRHWWRELYVKRKSGLWKIGKKV